MSPTLRRTLVAGAGLFLLAGMTAGEALALAAQPDRAATKCACAVAMPCCDLGICHVRTAASRERGPSFAACDGGRVPGSAAVPAPPVVLTAAVALPPPGRTGRAPGPATRRRPDRPADPPFHPPRRPPSA